MVLAGFVFCQLNGAGAFHVVNNGKLAVLGANNGHIGFNLGGINHGDSPTLNLSG
jgi:hypothetical protein